MHNNDIIHRDLKPSNILVTMDHGDPLPKVIDFGIATKKDKDLLTKRVGTPYYVAPEVLLKNYD